MSNEFDISRGSLEIASAVASMFSPQLNSNFRFRHEAAEPGATELELIDVSDKSLGDHINFTLVFRGPQQPMLPQRIYPVEHGELGGFDLFIVPIKRDAQGVYYEAIFNRVDSASVANAGS